MVQKWRDRLASRTVPEEVKKTIEEELTRIEGMESNSLEFSMLRNYLDWLTILPWGCARLAVLRGSHVWFLTCSQQVHGGELRH